MNQNIKNFIEEGEKLKEEFIEELKQGVFAHQGLNSYEAIANWWIEKFSSRQISLIKMFEKYVRTLLDKGKGE